MFPSLRTSAAYAICFALLGGDLSAAGPKERANVLVKPSRELLRSLAVARDAAANARYAEAAVELRKILSPAAGDGFLPLDSLYGSQRTVKSEAIRLLDAMPPEGRQLYEMQCKAEVERGLEEAIRRGDRAALAEIAQNHLPSGIAAEVVLLLARDALDRGAPDECLAWLRCLQAAPVAGKAREVEIAILKAAGYLMRGEPLPAREALGGLKAIAPPAAFRLGVEELTSADPPDRLLACLGGAEKSRAIAENPARSGEWPLYRGDAARNAMAAWSGALGPRRWKLGTLDGAESQQFSNWRRSDADDVLFCCLHPLIVGDLLLARSPRRLTAFDLRSGRRIWENPPPNKIKDAKNGGTERDPELWQRFWEDAPFGQISSNGSEVFLLDGLGVAQAGNSAPRAILVGGRLQIIAAKPVQPYNRLVALGLRQQGKMMWSIGGADGEGEPQLAGCFFLGPPLPHGDRLYVLAEKEGIIRLCALNAARGNLEWSLALAQADAEILVDPVRRLAGASPSMSEGILICPTSAGAAAAVDPVTRRLLWGFQYPVAENLVDRGPMGIILPGGRIQPLRRAGINRTVRDAAVVLAAGRTLLLPVEADSLYCLDSSSGELLWSCPREEMRFIAGVTADKVVLAGERGLFARNLRTGKAAWPEECVELPGKSQIIGRGFIAGQYYYLPSTWNELVKFDLDAGRIAERFPNKNPLGNLTPAGNLLISHTGNAIQVFDPAEKSAPHFSQ
ncbi:MAG: PQQ-binding-like beta-propeller repeat protein [Pirellulales bacterium]|nr:PQQ-binding-like beta-propeller repeat protein [Pirellulales bacterium]